jgi:ribosomal protein S12 methylthiotransferase RimO
MKLHLISLGCVKNLVDSEVMLGRLQDYKLTNSVEDADLIIINSCGFIESAKVETIETIIEVNENRKKNSILVVSGCLSERYKNLLQSELPEVDIWTGVGDYDKIDELISEKKSMFSDKVYLIHNDDRVITNSNYHAYIKLSEGCNQKCSFCAIPSFKGRLNSRDIDEVISEIKKLKKRGFKDFSLASQDSSSYLRDKGFRDGLERLIDEIDKIDDINVRILYLYPTTTTKKLIYKILNSKNVQNYFDIPIQHISDKMLKVMKRGSSVKKLKELLNLMQTKFSFVRTSVIIGHPAESEDDFEILKNFLKSYHFDRVNVFAYSDEEGTSAYSRKDKIDKKTINRRIKEIEKIIDKSTQKRLKNYLNKEIETFLDGLTDDKLFYSVRPKLWTPDVDGDILINESLIENLQIGKIYKVIPNQLAKNQLIGKII